MGRKAKNPPVLVAPVSSKKQLLTIEGVRMFLGGISPDSLKRLRRTFHGWTDDMARTRKDMVREADRMSDGVSKQWDQMKDAVSKDNNAMLRSTTTQFGAIGRELRKALKGLGLSGPGIQKAMSGGDPKINKAARGMRIPGIGNHDTIPVAPNALLAENRYHGIVSCIRDQRSSVGRSSSGVRASGIGR